MMWCIFCVLVCVAVATSATGPCAVERAAVDARYNSEPGLTGLERPNCDADGNYIGMQYAGSQARCVTLTGTVIDGYMVNKWETGTMDCQCARDEYDNRFEKTGIIGMIRYCEANGNYAKVGCTGSVCYCQDKFGKQIGTSTANIGTQDSLNC